MLRPTSPRLRRPLRHLGALLVAVLLATGLQAGTLAPAQAAGCYGTGCDNLGPKGNGCFADKRNIASGGDNHTRLYYSPSCRAFWAWSKNGARWWSTEVHLEMEHLEMISANTQGWVFKRRLTIRKDPEEATEWTNALGARTGKYRFRALWVDKLGGLGPIVTPWATVKDV